MCDVSGKLIAWMDGELPESESAAIARHLDDCAECRGCLTAYRNASELFAMYRDEASANANVRRPRLAVRPWVAVAASVAVVAALAIPLLRRPAMPSPVVVVRQDSGVGVGVGVSESTPAPSSEEVVSRSSNKVTTKHGVHPTQTKSRTSLEARQISVRSSAIPEPDVEIAIPAEAMFPPGAVPDGFNFVADVTLGPDGSAERLRLEPRLVNFEGRASRP